MARLHNKPGPEPQQRHRICITISTHVSWRKVTTDDSELSALQRHSNSRKNIVRSRCPAVWHCDSSHQSLPPALHCSRDSGRLRLAVSANRKRRRSLRLRQCWRRCFNDGRPSLRQLDLLGEVILLATLQRPCCITKRRPGVDVFRRRRLLRARTKNSLGAAAALCVASIVADKQQQE